MIVKISLKHKHSFYRLAAFGFGIVYIFQIFLTVGGGIKFIPLTGVTLPFISYGGSSILTTMLMFFILHGIYMIALRDSDKLVMEENEAYVEKRQMVRRTDELEIIDYDAEDEYRDEENEIEWER